MNPDEQFPIDLDTAHRCVRRYLDTGTLDKSSPHPVLAAARCLRSSTPACQHEGAALIAESADESDWDIDPILYDLATATDAPHAKTRAYVMGVFARLAVRLPLSAADRVDVIPPRLIDSDPLVREAACAALAWIAHEHIFDAFPDSGGAMADLPADVVDQFDRSTSLLFAQLDPERADSKLEWHTAFALEHPEAAFWGPVDAGESRRASIRREVMYALAALAPLFPDRIREQSHLLIEVALEADEPEARGYAVDTLGRADAVGALQEVRERASNLLESQETVERGVSILYSLTHESPSLLVEAAPVLATNLDSLEQEERSYATEMILRAAAHDTEDITETVGDIVYASLTTRSDVGPVSAGSPSLLAAVAANDPELVLPRALRAVGLLSNEAGYSREQHSSSEEATRWDADAAWETMIETAKQARQIVWDSLDIQQLRENLTADGSVGTHSRELYAHVVPTPPPEDDLSTLVRQLCADAPGAHAAVSTLLDRARDPVVSAIVNELEEASAPPQQALSILAEVTAGGVDAVTPIKETAWSWNQTIQPTDKRWEDLVTILGQLATATDDTDMIPKMLHLEESTYCSRFLKTDVAADLIEAAPNQAVPALLEHLSHGSASLRRRIIRTFDEFPDAYGGWSSQLREALFEQLTDEERRVRVAATRTLGEWFQELSQNPTEPDDEWSMRIRDALIDRLADEHRQVRVYAIRSLGTVSDPAVREALRELRATEMNPSVRFEAQRVLC